MPTKFSKGQTIAALIAVVAMSQSGCQSGWKMPSASIFPWSKKPSESTLAGSNPSLSVPSQSSGSAMSSYTTPANPSSRNTPSLLSSANNRPSSPYGSPTGANPLASAPNFGTPNATRGLVANANGYQTGPYSTGNAAPTGYSAPPAFGGPSGAYAPANGLASSAPTPGFGPTPGGFPNPGQGMTGLPAPAGLPPTQPASLASNQFDGGPSSNGFGANGPAYGTPQNTIPAIPAGMSSTNMASLPQASQSYGMPNASQQGFASSQPNMTAATYGGAAPYKPGSTARSTGYDFSRPSTPSTGTTNVPHTANGLPMPPQQNLYR